MKKYFQLLILILLVSLSGCSDVVEDYEKGVQIAQNVIDTVENYNMVEITLDSEKRSFDGVIYGVYNNGSTKGIGPINDGIGLYNKTYFESYLIEIHLNGTKYISNEIFEISSELNLDSESVMTRKYAFLWAETLVPIGVADVYADDTYLGSLPKTGIIDTVPENTDILLINGTYEGSNYQFIWELNKGDLRDYIIPLYISKEQVIDTVFSDNIDLNEIENSIIDLLSKKDLAVNTKLSDIASDAHLEYLDYNNDLNDFVYNKIQSKSLSYYHQDWFVEEVVVYEGKDYLSVLQKEISETFTHLKEETELDYSELGVNVECYSRSYNSVCEVFVLIATINFQNEISIDGLSYTSTFFFQNLDVSKINLQLDGRHVFNAYIISKDDLADFESQFVYSLDYQDFDFKEKWIDVTKLDQDLVVTDDDILIIENSLEIENDFTYRFEFSK